MNGDGATRVPNTANIHFDHIDGEAMVIALDLKGVAVSTGAACSSGAIEASHVLLAMGLRPDQARASIRFSLGKQTSRGRYRFRSRACTGDGGPAAGAFAAVQAAGGQHVVVRQILLSS